MNAEKQKSRVPWWVVIPGTMAFIAIATAGEDVAVPVFGMLAVTSWIAIPVWFAHKRKMAQQELQQKSAKNPEIESEFTRMKERLENLETLMCNLDREINMQLEQSLTAARISTGADVPR